MQGFVERCTEQIASVVQQDKALIRYLVSSWSLMTKEEQIAVLSNVSPDTKTSNSSLSSSKKDDKRKKERGKKEGKKENKEKSVSNSRLIDLELLSLLPTGISNVAIFGQEAKKFAETIQTNILGTICFVIKDLSKVAGLEDRSIDVFVLSRTLSYMSSEETLLFMSVVVPKLSPQGKVITLDIDWKGDIATFLCTDIIDTLLGETRKLHLPVPSLPSLSSSPPSLSSSLPIFLETYTLPQDWQALTWKVFGTKLVLSPSLTHVNGTEWKSRQNPYYAELLLHRQQNTLPSPLLPSLSPSPLPPSSLSSPNLEPSSLVPKIMQFGTRKFTLQDAFLQPNAKQLRYSDPIGKSLDFHSVKWGQMKLFCSTLFALVYIWDWKRGLPTVVYAGAADGWNIEILAWMFPKIKWILYDTRVFEFAPNPNIEIHTGPIDGLFSDEKAKLYTGMPNIMFLSDIRYSKVESYVIQDHVMQARWLRIISPVVSMLKFRLPYADPTTNMNSFEYLPGDVLFQPFNGLLSSETRLIVFGVPQETKVWDNNEYEAQLFFHNVVTRHSVEWLVPERDRDIDNHYDSAYAMFCLEGFIAMSGWDKKPLALFHEVVDMLNKHTIVKVVISEERSKSGRK